MGVRTLATATTDFERYDRVAIALHWLIALLILANWPLGYFHEFLEHEVGWNDMWWHRSLGLAVLFLSLARLAWRLVNRPPPRRQPLEPWRETVARLTHASLYVLMVLVPLTGWMRSSSGKRPISFFDLFDLPKFAIERGSTQAFLARESHEWLSWAMVALVVLHVAAALHHHFRLRDALLLRMVPARGR